MGKTYRHEQIHSLNHQVIMLGVFQKRVTRQLAPDKRACVVGYQRQALARTGDIYKRLEIREELGRAGKRGSKRVSSGSKDLVFSFGT